MGFWPLRGQYLATTVCTVLESGQSDFYLTDSVLV